MSNPLVDRILNNPLTFVSGKHPEQDVQSEKSAGYIVLSSSAKKAPVMPKKEKKSEPVRPKSMAEAIAAYTGKKFEQKKKKRKMDLKRDVDESASEKVPDSEVRPESAVPEDPEPGMKRSDPDSDVGVDLGSESPESDEYESASESAHGQSEISDEPQTASPKSEAFPETDDSDEDVESESDSESESESESGSESGSESKSESESENEKSQQLFKMDNESEDLGEEVGTADQAGSAVAEKDEAAQPTTAHKPQKSLENEKIQLKQDLLDEARKTPPAADHVEPEIDLSAVQTLKTGEGQFRWPESFHGKKPVGLLNFGVTCYMNSAIQTLIHIPALQQYLQQVVQEKHVLPARSVTHTFAELANRMWNGTSKKYMNPKKLVSRLDDINCMMSEWQQEDSHEYFMSLMSRLQEDSTPKGAKLNSSILYDIFGGLLSQEVVCQKCKTSSVTKQEFYDLSLGFTKRRRSSAAEPNNIHKESESAEKQKIESSKDGNSPQKVNKADLAKESPSEYSIERALADFFSMETIRGDKKDHNSGYWCESCKKNTVATKKSKVERAPQTLMVHMKRFKFNGNSSSKVKQPIRYNKFLDLGPYAIDDVSHKYQLMSVIVHEGRSISSGHYIAHCLQPDNTWSTYDDEYVHAIDERSALSDPSAYCLVYMKLHAKKKRAAGSSGASPKRHKRL